LILNILWKAAFRGYLVAFQEATARRALWRHRHPWVTHADAIQNALSVIALADCLLRWQPPYCATTDKQDRIVTVGTPYRLIDGGAQDDLRKFEAEIEN